LDTNSINTIERMSETPSLADADEPRVVTDLVERQERRLLEKTNEQLEQYIRQAIAEVDWSEVEVLDIVHKVTTTEYGGFDGETGVTRGHSFQYHGYESAALAPNTDTYYGIGEYNKQVYRLTEYVCREVGIDPETGEDVA